MKSKQNIELGLRKNWVQFSLLVLVNAFVGGMVGMERSIFPQFADEVFGISSATAILSFITAFGISKAGANYFAGRFANSIGRRNLLLIGWILSIPIPVILLWAPSWNWVLFANVLLGISQGLTWSSTVVMKIDLVGDKNRGLAMGLNEFAGYLSVGVVAYITADLAQNFGVVPYPFYLGLGISILGFLLTLFFVKDTRHHVNREESVLADPDKNLSNVFIDTTFKNKTLSSISQAGMVNNLNDGMIWGLFPLLLAAMNFSMEELGIIVSIYPAVWGIGQLFTGKMADHYSKKNMLFWGMLLQGIAILMIPNGNSMLFLIGISSALGLGTAIVYPTFLAAIADATNPNQRAESIGTFRLWRDLGYAFGAISSGILADLFGVEIAIMAIGIVTVLSSIVIQVRMPRN